MQDESLIDEMRAALRGDRERAESRRLAAPPAPVAREAAPSGREREAAQRRGLLGRLALRRRREPGAGF